MAGLLRARSINDMPEYNDDMKRAKEQAKVGFYNTFKQSVETVLDQPKRMGLSTDQVLEGFEGVRKKAAEEQTKAKTSTPEEALAGILRNPNEALSNPEVGFPIVQVLKEQIRKESPGGKLPPKGELARSMRVMLKLAGVDQETSRLFISNYVLQ
jgi:hypothetical protein